MLQRDVAARLLAPRRARRDYGSLARAPPALRARRARARPLARAASSRCRTCARASCARPRAPTRRSAPDELARSRRSCAPRSGTRRKTLAERAARAGCPRRPEALLPRRRDRPARARRGLAPGAFVRSPGRSRGAGLMEPRRCSPRCVALAGEAVLVRRVPRRRGDGPRPGQRPLRLRGRALVGSRPGGSAGAPARRAARAPCASHAARGPRDRAISHRPARASRATVDTAPERCLSSAARGESQVAILIEDTKAPPLARRAARKTEDDASPSPVRSDPLRDRDGGSQQASSRRAPTVPAHATASRTRTARLRSRPPRRGVRPSGRRVDVFRASRAQRARRTPMSTSPVAIGPRAPRHGPRRSRARKRAASRSRCSPPTTSPSRASSTRPASTCCSSATRSATSCRATTPRCP